ncbi:putative conjugative transfer protein TraD [Legionella quinlivanii]|uniref:Putative conjugative transfer protein TraD n=1 Tax=Legionella quinlivanii TaxID=45073 RepID=A0A0W0XSR1_9GAMM|nr:MULTISPECIES: type IV conjugative transfer system coupling protein TraD [Legionella]KTD47494.1 putative conjugative transfer protein TraD [Legionella quinlivanii]MCE3043699.1 type IV conjugative transfer system coupling protein TraD [Legionella sp. 16cNR16C]SEG49289.1 type IV conjugative transfer system coupling protein TraD [Legionella quinlivanii DSM 21216]STY49819.1 putative conjugative transfer protein TraD [Legionella quinlivanii]
MKQSILQFISGGQIFDYKTKMMIQVSNRIFGWAIFGFMVLFSLIMIFYAWTELKLFGLNQISHILVKAHYEDQVLWTNLNGSKVTAAFYQNSPIIQSAVRLAKESLISKSKVSLFFGGAVYLLITLLFSRFFIKLGEKYTKDQFVSGTRLAASPKETIQSVSGSKRGASEIKLLNRIPMPMYSEKQGMLFHGTTGAGKTQAMMMLLDQIRALGEPAIIYDKECTIKPYFFDERIDIELNPVSTLCANWKMWRECANPLEFGSFASYLIPKSVQGSDPFWVDSARTIFTSMAWKIRDYAQKDPVFLLQLLLTTSLEEIRGILKGTESENLVSKEIEKTAISIKSVLATYTKALRFLEGLDKSGKEDFSIKEWIQNTTDPKKYNKGWLFITSRSKYHKEIKPLISLWLGLAMQGVQSLMANNKGRIWLVMDELASLHRLETISDTLADIRKFGGCVAIGIQSIAQLDFIYGTHEAGAIADLLNTSIYFRSPKSKVAEWVSKDLGSQVINEMKESQSYGPDSVRDGNTVGSQRAKRNTVEEGDIMTLDDMECYIRLVGNHPITRLKNKYIDRQVICVPLIERAINFDALEKVNHSALMIQNDPSADEAVKKIHQFEQLAHDVSDKDLILPESPFAEPKAISSSSHQDPNAIELRESSIVIKDIF